jgi:tripeptide aminopeptidase
MNTKFDQELEERLVRYAAIDSQADVSSDTSPSSDTQLELLNLLVEELQEMGAQDVRLTDYGVVLATIPATLNTGAPTIAFLAHVDTSPGFNATGVRPLVHHAWDGRDLVLPDDPNQILSPIDQPYLASKVGDDIITAGGTTLLGADDKAGVAIIMTMARYLLSNPDFLHGRIRVCFTPDEEIGRGVHNNLPVDLDAKVAYTLDGGPLGEVVYETFSADGAKVDIRGVSAHPGEAKDVMVNALHLAVKIINALPQTSLTPETTDGREGFIHLARMQGGAAAAQMHFLLRDFELYGLQAKRSLLQKVCDVIQAGEPRAQISCEFKEQYRNMRYWLEQDMQPVDLALEACRQIGVEPVLELIRGGTDGSRLTEQGVPTPNLFTGMQNIHGPLEWISVQDMARSTELCLRLVKLWVEKEGGQ